MKRPVNLSRLSAPLVDADRRRWLLAAGGSALGLGVAHGANPQQQFPRSQGKIIVPYTPGGPTDVVARLVAQKLQETWSQPVIVDYKPGAGTTIGADFVAKSTPGAQVIGIVGSAFTINPALRKAMPYDTVKDLAGITQIASVQLAIVARPDAPFNTLAELIAYAKRSPGKLSYGTAGAGSGMHLGAELLKREGGFDMLHAPFKGSAPAYTELMGGRIDLVVDALLATTPYVKSGRMKMIATMGDRRVDGFDYPVVSETLPGFQVSGMLGLVVPRATSSSVIGKIQQDVASVLQEPDTKRRIEEQGMTVVASTPAQFDALLQSEMKRWAGVVNDAGIQLD
jgi:tripartite-type tricarboxylate transporter receptor subunit TctC